MDSHIIKSLDHNSALGLLFRHLTRLLFSNAVQNILVCDRKGMVFLVVLIHPVYYMAFLESAVSYCGKTGVPVTETIFSEDFCLILRSVYLVKINSMGLGIVYQSVFSLEDVLLLKLTLKPLIYLILCLSALYNLKPVPARSLGVLGSDNLQSVSILDDIINRYKLSVDLGTHHLVTHC